jgi:hypothetical protein
VFANCIFCHADLGKNEAIEHFPVGRRLAFDAAKGRLWVVCRSCERWNLTPLEERWEAIEECERFYRDTKLRVSTDNIGLCRTRDGTDLVRIGEPRRPEMAAWRYGDQFGRRRKKYIVMTAAGIAAVGGYFVAGPVMGLVGSGGIQLLNVVNIVAAWRGGARLNHQGEVLRVQRIHLRHVVLRPSGNGDWELEVPYFQGFLPTLDTTKSRLSLRGDDALRVASKLLPYLNESGGTRASVGDAVRLLEAAPSAHALFEQSARARRRWWYLLESERELLVGLSAPRRLALEMALHEDDERRALEGELATLEDRWREAEEIAAISDNMFLPGAVVETFRKLRGTK